MPSSAVRDSRRFTQRACELLRAQDLGAVRLGITFPLAAGGRGDTCGQLAGRHEIARLARRKRRRAFVDQHRTRPTSCIRSGGYKDGWRFERSSLKAKIAHVPARPTPQRVPISPSSWASSPGVRRSMQSNRRTDTVPEQRIRSLVHNRGLRFRKDFAIKTEGLRVRADIAFPRARVAVFVDGCFWHCCPQHATFPKTNQAFWEAKLARNVERDRRVEEHLRATGWIVLRFWEHEDPDAVASSICASVYTVGTRAA